MTEAAKTPGTMVTILKDGNRINIDENDLSKDDVVILQTGDVVPADLELVESKGLVIDEFDITGEIMPVEKMVGDEVVRLYMGSKVLKGTGKGSVVATGEQTEYGRITAQSRALEQPDPVPVLKRKYFILAALLLPAFIILFIQSGDSPFIAAAYLALSAAVIVLQNDALFQNMRIQKEARIFRQKNLQIRDACAVKRLSQVDTVCFDKTGVLTTREMTVSRVLFADMTVDDARLPSDNETMRLVKIGSALCNDVLFYERIEQANPVDKALIQFSQMHGIDIKELFAAANHFYEQPFDSEHRYMASGIELPSGEVVYFIKGDPGVILRMCDRYLTAAGSNEKVDFQILKLVNSFMQDSSREGASTIAIAYRSGSQSAVPASYTFLCVFQLSNRLQAGAREVIHAISAGGMRTFLLTGDRAETAVKIANDSGIVHNSRIYLTGRDIDKMGWSETVRQSSNCSIFARMIPSQKGVLIRLLQQKGYTIAMVGDGPNDGIALKAADIGISFVTNSSPIARRLATILINDLIDLQTVFQSAKRFQTSVRNGKVIRILLLAAAVLGAYAWAAASFLR